MNRRLYIPAVCSMLAFASLYLVLNRAVGLARDSAGTSARTSSAPAVSQSPPERSKEAERLLQSLCDAYVERWQTWESSPHRLFSRAAPRGISPTAVERVLSPKSNDEPSALQLATISIRRGTQGETIPGVVDSTTRRTYLFREGKWLTEDEWLNTAPSVPEAKQRASR